MTKQVDVYGPFMKGWQSKVLGSKPTPDMLATIEGLGLRAGKQAMANAMALRPEGVSGAQIVMVCGAPQLNRMRGLIAAGVVKREAVAANEQGHTVYKLTLTAKGTAAIKRAADAADKATLATAATPKAKAKPRKGNAKAATVTAPAVTPEVTPAADAPQGDAPQA